MIIHEHLPIVALRSDVRYGFLAGGGGARAKILPDNTSRQRLVTIVRRWLRSFFTSSDTSTVKLWKDLQQLHTKLMCSINSSYVKQSQESPIHKNQAQRIIILLKIKMIKMDFLVIVLQLLRFFSLYLNVKGILINATNQVYMIIHSY